MVHAVMVGLDVMPVIRCLSGCTYDTWNTYEPSRPIGPRLLQGVCVYSKAGGSAFNKSGRCARPGTCHKERSPSRAGYLARGLLLRVTATRVTQLTKISAKCVQSIAGVHSRLRA